MPRISQVGRVSVTHGSHVYNSHEDSPEDWVDEDGKNTVAGWWEDREAGGVDWYLDEKLTHWMPLPAPPSSDPDNHRY